MPAEKKKKKKNTRVFVSGQVPPKRRSLRALRARRQEGSKCGGHNDDQPLGLRARDAGTAPSGVSLAFAPHQTPRTLVVSRTGREKTGGFRACLLKRSRRVAPRRRPSSPPTTSTSLRLRGNRVPYHGYSRVRAPCFSTMHCLPSFWLRPISLGPNAAAGGAVEIGSWKPGNQAKSDFTFQWFANGFQFEECPAEMSQKRRRRGGGRGRRTPIQDRAIS